jgi:hypothetical protein
MTEPPEYREIECIGRPCDGFAHVLRLQDLAADPIYEPIDPFFYPEDLSYPQRLALRASLPKHPGAYRLEEADGSPVYRWHPDGDEDEAAGGARAKRRDQ